MKLVLAVYWTMCIKTKIHRRLHFISKPVYTEITFASENKFMNIERQPGYHA